MPAISSFLAAAAITTTLGQAFTQSQAIESRGDYETEVYRTNTRLANLQAEDAIQRGDEDSDTHKEQVKVLIGRQRAILAAQGIEINADSGSPISIQEETAALGALDALTIRNNAWRESWGFKVQAADFEARANFAEIEARNNASNTLLTGGLQALNTGLNLGYYRQIGKPTTTTPTPTTVK